MPRTRAPSGAAVFRPAVTDAITDAALGELAEQGYARLSMERVARRAGVGKSALYRRWPSKVAMVTDVLRQLSLPPGRPPRTGDLRGDLRAIADAVHGWIVEPRVGAILPDLIAESRRDPELAAATAAHVSAPRRAWVREVLDEAPYRATLDDREIDLLLDLVIAPVYWSVTHDRPVTAAYLDTLVDTVVDGLARRSPGPAP